MRISFLIICYCFMLSCTRSIQYPSNSIFYPRNTDDSKPSFASLDMSFGNEATSFTTVQLTFQAHSFAEPEKRYYAITANNGTYYLEVRFKIDSLSFFQGKSLSVQPTYFSILRYGRSSIASSIGSNIQLSVQMTNYSLQGYFTGMFYNQENGKRCDVSAAFGDLSLSLTD